MKDGKRVFIREGFSRGLFIKDVQIFEECGEFKNLDKTLLKMDKILLRTYKIIKKFKKRCGVENPDFSRSSGDVHF